MATLELVSDRPARDRFFVFLAAAMAAFAFLGFAPTYWLQLPTGSFAGPPLLHLHGLLFSSWTLLVVGQAWRRRATGAGIGRSACPAWRWRH